MFVNLWQIFRNGKMRGIKMLVLIMIDELGDEVEVERFNIGNDLDEDYFELWKQMKIDQAREHYQEAWGFYFEDRRKWNYYGGGIW